MRKRVCILYTGGTIGMVETAHGYAPKKDYFPLLLDQVSQLRHSDIPLWDIIEFDPLLDSSNIAVEQWNQIGKAIYQRYNDYDGFVVLHGTDTMSYTASALSFMLEGLNKPVILTGAQIPLCKVRSDGRDNLINSMIIASQGIANEVCLYFGEKLFRGNRSTKMSADQLMAFTSPNYPALANVGIEIKYNKHALLKPEQPKTLRLVEFSQIPIGVLKIFPGIQFDLFEQIISEKLKGVVLETFGEGNIPNDNSTFIESMKRISKNGSLIAVCSQCYQGVARLGTYETSSDLKHLGAVACLDMTTEAAVSKLYYLFSSGFSLEEIKKLTDKNLRGELSDSFCF